MRQHKAGDLQNFCVTATCTTPLYSVGIQLNKSPEGIPAGRFQFLEFPLGDPIQEVCGYVCHRQVSHFCLPPLATKHDEASCCQDLIGAICLKNHAETMALGAIIHLRHSVFAVKLFEHQINHPCPNFRLLVKGGLRLTFPKLVCPADY